MSGLDKIISGIELEAEKASKRITDEALREAERIIARADAAAAEEERRAAQEAELEYKKITARAVSAGELEASRAILREKQRIISAVIDKARADICAAKDDEYSDFLIKLLDKYATGDAGELVLSAKDKARINDAFRTAAAKKRLDISDKACDTDGGFILVYGDIEENCTIDALMESERDALYDAASAVLF